MSVKHLQRSLPLLAIMAALLTGLMHTSPSAQACTRAVYLGSDNLVVAGRSMDWVEDIHSNIWVFPRSMARQGAAGPDSLEWTSRYGSLIISGYEAGTADGINEKGLVVNALYLAESDYGVPTAGKPTLSIMAWAQYVLDSYATVDEAVGALSTQAFTVIAPILPDGSGAQLHLAISDPSGDSAIFEYLDGKLVIHHGRQYTVMTNSPSFDQQLAINRYWEKIGGMSFLPGTIRAADRFVRASFLIEALPRTVDANIITAVPDQRYAYQAVAGVLGVIRAVSVPLGIADPDAPNIASTLWRVVYDQKDRVMYFDSATTPNAFWIPLADLDFAPEAGVRKLLLEGGKVYAGNAAAHFEAAEPFVFLSASPQ